MTATKRYKELCPTVLGAAAALAFLLGLCGTTFAAVPQVRRTRRRRRRSSKQNARLATYGAGTALGKRINDLRSAEAQEQSSAGLAQVIAVGKNNMLSFASSLTKEQTHALVKYARGLLVRSNGRMWEN